MKVIFALLSLVVAISAKPIQEVVTVGQGTESITISTSSPDSVVIKAENPGATLDISGSNPRALSFQPATCEYETDFFWFHKRYRLRAHGVTDVYKTCHEIYQGLKRSMPQCSILYFANCEQMLPETDGLEMRFTVGNMCSRERIHSAWWVGTNANSYGRLDCNNHAEVRPGTIPMVPRVYPLR